MITPWSFIASIGILPPRTPGTATSLNPTFLARWFRNHFRIALTYFSLNHSCCHSVLACRVLKSSGFQKASFLTSLRISAITLRFRLLDHFLWIIIWAWLFWLNFHHGFPLPRLLTQPHHLNTGCDLRWSLCLTWAEYGNSYHCLWLTYTPPSRTCWNNHRNRSLRHLLLIQKPDFPPDHPVFTWANLSTLSLFLAN